MNRSHACVTPQRLRQLLENELSAQEWSVLEDHVTHCASCRGTMDAAAEDGQWQQEVRDALGDDQRADGWVGQLDSAVEDVPGEDDDSLRRLRELLGPTDDPRMLGRIGPYEIAGILGRGGMGVVFKGFDPALNRYMAIKMLLPHLATSAAARKRFAREARAAAAVVNDHVMAIHGVAEWQGMPYLVMPYARGVSLQRRLDDKGPLSVTEILRIGMQAAAGLAAAHAQGLVHRDVKPANILLADGVERVTLTDFGLARAVDDISLTRVGVLAGTPPFMSPEQARGQAVDARSDLFSLGSVLYAMCTGQPPFRADSSYGVLRLVTDHEPCPIREMNTDIPEWLCAIVGKLMAKHRDERFASAGEVAELLKLCLAHLQQPVAVHESSPPGRAPRTDVPLGVEAMVFRLLGKDPAERCQSAAEITELREDNGPNPDLPDMCPALPWLLRRPQEIANRSGAGGMPATFPYSWMLVVAGVLALVSGLALWFIGVEGSRGTLSGTLVELPDVEISEGVWTLAFSPDGKRLVIGGGSPNKPGQFQIWDVAGGQPLVARWAHRGVRAVAYSPDGNVLATGHWGGDIKLRDPLTGIEQTRLTGHASGVNCLAFSADGALLASAGLDGKVRFWDVKARREGPKFLQLRGVVFSVAFFHDGHTLATSGDDGVARIWNLDTRKERVVLQGHTAKQVEALAVSPDDQVVATGSWDGTVKLWDPQTGKATATLQHEEGWVLAVAFSPNGRLLASAGADGMVRIWDLASRTLLKSIRQHGWFARAVAFSPDGKLLASGSEDKTARLWDVAAGEDVATFSVDRGEPSPDSPADAKFQVDSKGRPNEAVARPDSHAWLTLLVLSLLLIVAAVFGAWIGLRRWRAVKDQPGAAANASIQAEARSSSFTCSGCRKKFKAPVGLAGKKIKCPNCGTVESAAEPEAETTSGSA